MIRGRVDDFFIIRLFRSFLLFQIKFHCTFSISYKILNYYVYCCIIAFSLGSNRPLGLPFFFVPALLLSILTPLFLLSSSYFSISVPMRKYLGKHSCMSFTFPIAILNRTCFFPTVQLQVHNANSERKTRNH